MSTASLTKLTVPLASDQSNSAQGLLMPKLKFRFRVTFLNLGVTQPTTELTKQVMDFTRPTVTFADIDVPIYNSTVKLAGKYSWENITCQVRDDAGGNVSRLVGEQIQKQLDFSEMASAASGIDYKFLTRFEILDGGNGAGEPVVLENWEIYGCYLQQVNYNNMDYSLSEVATVSMTIRFDNANQINQPGGVGIATTLGRIAGDVATGAG
jgi:hypothetical protein